MSSQLLLGDEAIALGAIESGISGVYAYPGTPSTEITEYIQAHPLANQRNIHRKWAANEKTAMESALGMSYAGKRALVCMKHVGLNVASDAFMNAAITGVNGGLVILVADDPSMHSSQNEQDSRFFAKFALIPALEPTNQQEAYDMTRFGFDFSEKYKVPVMLRVTTRLAHSRAGVNSQNVLDENPLKLPENPMQFILLPALARKYYKTLLDKQEAFENESNTSVYNAYFEGSDRSMGIVACGIAFNYLMENYPEGCPFPVVKVSQYPIPKALVQRLESECEKLLILEEGYPLVEEQLKDYFGKGKPVHGRLDGTLPRDGELNPDLVAQAIRPEKVELYQVPPVVVNRPPALCQGCGHQDVHGFEPSDGTLWQRPRVCRYWLLYFGCAFAFQLHQHVCRYGCLYHHGQRCLRCWLVPRRCGYWRFNFHTLRYYGLARRCERTNQYGCAYFRQRIHFDDRRPRFVGLWSHRANMRRSRS